MPCASCRLVARMAGSESKPERHDLLLVGDAELARGLDRVDGVVAAVRQRDDFRLRRLRLQHEGREVGGAKRMADRSPRPCRRSFR